MRVTAWDTAGPAPAETALPATIRLVGSVSSAADEQLAATRGTARRDERPPGRRILRAAMAAALVAALIPGAPALPGPVPPVFQNNRVLGMGANLHGQLGANTTYRGSLTVVRALGVPTTIRKVSAGTFQTIGLDSSGNLWGWGYNGDGRLGDGTTTDRLAAVRIHGIANVVQVATGDNHTLAVRADGTVWAWGNNSFGALGDGTRINRIVPTQVAGITGAVAVAVGIRHSVVLQSNGSVLTWGANPEGQLGDGTTTDRLIPGPVPGLNTITKIAAGGMNSAGIRADGRLVMWGYNGDGTLGVGDSETHLAPVLPVNLTGVTQVAVGLGHVLALAGDGRLWAWGDNGSYQLGDGTSTGRTIPALITSSPAGIVHISAGTSGSLAVTSAGQVWHWGWIHGTEDPTLTPVAGISNAFHASLGFRFLEAVIEIPLDIG